NPNQKIITIGAISLGLVVLNILLHIISITITVLVFPKNKSNGSCNEIVIREYNETVRVEKVTQ
ncbi:neuraminidase, partial [Influenza A virus (A/duck/Victoria/5383/2002(H4N8))]